MWRYRLLLVLLSLPLVIYTGWIAAREKNARYFRERLGFTKRTNPGGIWIHAASVGEVNAVMPLVQLLADTRPDTALTLTTNTPTGAMVAQRQLPPHARHKFLPIDWNSASRRFLNQVAPAHALIMETELWPNLYNLCVQHEIPLVIINGRLSSRTMRAQPWLRRLYADCLAATRAVLARSPEDRDRFIELGATAEKVQVSGNIKYATAVADRAEPIDLGRAYVLAASTHADEELRISRLWLQTFADSPSANRLLVIAPRHPKRLGDILKQLAPLNSKIAVRSRNEPVTPATRIYIADTFGELGGFIAGSELVFMGGSLVPVGGHNILEVGVQGKAVVFGPHMENFALEAKEFLEADAAIQVFDDQGLVENLRQLLGDADNLARLGTNGAALMQRNTEMAQSYLDQLSGVCPDI